MHDNFLIVVLDLLNLSSNNIKLLIPQKKYERLSSYLNKYNLSVSIYEDYDFGRPISHFNRAIHWFKYSLWMIKSYLSINDKKLIDVSYSSHPSTFIVLEAYKPISHIIFRPILKNYNIQKKNPCSSRYSRVRIQKIIF
jgi:hypothetical protein